MNYFNNMDIGRGILEHRRALFFANSFEILAIVGGLLVSIQWHDRIDGTFSPPMWASLSVDIAPKVSERVKSQFLLGPRCVAFFYSRFHSLS